MHKKLNALIREIEQTLFVDDECSSAYVSSADIFDRKKWDHASKDGANWCIWQERLDGPMALSRPFAPIVR